MRLAGRGFDKLDVRGRSATSRQNFGTREQAQGSSEEQDFLLFQSEHPAAEKTSLRGRFGDGAGWAEQLKEMSGSLHLGRTDPTAAGKRQHVLVPAGSSLTRQ